MAADFSRADNTVIISDSHLADAEPPHPGNPLWKRFKRPKYFIDKSFKQFLEYIQKNSTGSIELILNGDIFDFDSVMVLPKKAKFHITLRERLRGLASDELKSRFKMGVILSDHNVWLEAIKEFILNGHRVVFVIGNHDMELHWPSVREEIINRMELPEEKRDQIRFCEWFFISNQDTMIEHGNQYDNYCLCSNPINPLIQKGNRIVVRLPFGNLAGKLMLNGMGLMNPHVEGSYIKTSFKEYMTFFYKYILSVQPFIIWTWFWGALVTLFHSVSEGMLPSLTDPLTFESRVQEIATRANASPAVVRSLRLLHVHPAIYNPVQIMRELWLDRALLLVFIFFASFWFYSALHVIMNVSVLWFVGPMFILVPGFIFYAHTVESEINKMEMNAIKSIPMISRLTSVQRVVFGHSHHEMQAKVNDIEYLNPGTWSPAFYDVECTKPYGRKCFVWIKPDQTGAGRTAELFEWKDPDIEKIQPSDPIVLKDGIVT